MFQPHGPTFLELARQALSSTERGYDLLAPTFDHTPFLTPDAIVAATVAQLGPVDDSLDVCCGTGVGLLALRPLTARRLLGVDISEGMLRVARAKLAGGPAQPVLEWLRCDARALPFEEEFDAVTCFGAFGHITPDDEAAFLGGIWRSLRPGGRFVFATAQRPPAFSLPSLISHGFNAVMRLRNALWRPPFVMYYLTFTLPQVRATLHRHGFEVSVVNPMLLDPYAGVRIVIAQRPPQVPEGHG